MESIPSVKEVYKIVCKYTDYGIQGYHVDNKYLDPRKMRQQKKYFQESLKSSRQNQPKQLKHKKTYFDEIQKIASKLPSPSTYNISSDDLAQISKKMSKYQSAKTFGKRKTIFEQMQSRLLKDHFPAGANYNINPENIKDKKGSSLSKAQNSTYIESSMRSSLDIPGTGQYNGKDERLKWIKNFVSWKAPHQLKNRREVKLPGVGAYTPIPNSYQLFQSMGQLKQKIKEKKNKNGSFDKQQRWKQIPQRNIPKGQYNIISDWGIKVESKLKKKKDILDKITRPSRGSVYH